MEQFAIREQTSLMELWVSYFQNI